MQPGLIFTLIGMFVSLFLCVRQWDKSWAFRYLPPIYGLIAGTILAIVWHTPATTVLTSLEVIAAFCAAGWIFWVAIWVEKRDRGRSGADTE